MHSQMPSRNLTILREAMFLFARRRDRVAPLFIKRKNKRKGAIPGRGGIEIVRGESPRQKATPILGPREDGVKRLPFWGSCANNAG